MRITMLLHKSVLHDSRVLREARTLAAEGHAVVVLELAGVPAGQEQLDGFRRSSVLPPEWVKRLLPFQLYRVIFAGSFVRAILRERPEVIHAHDAAMLLPGLIGRRLTGARLIYDSHELATAVPYRDVRWSYFVRLIERAAARRCAAVITVSDGIARRLQALYRLPLTPHVIRNVPDIAAGRTVTAHSLRGSFATPTAPVVLHQGSAAAGRGAEVLVRAVAMVPDAHLVFLGAPPSEVRPLLELAEELDVQERVHSLPPVAVQELLHWTAEADVGVSLLQDTCENHRLALPNKVFEYVAAGVPVVVSDLPELAKLVRSLGVGWTAVPHDPHAVAERLREAIAARRDPALRRRLGEAAHQLTWGNERERLLAVYREVCAAASASAT